MAETRNRKDTLKIPPHLVKDYRKERMKENRKVMSLVGLLILLYGIVDGIRNRFFPPNDQDEAALFLYFLLFMSLVVAGLMMIIVLKIVRNRRWVSFFNHFFLYLLIILTEIFALMDFRSTTEYTALMLMLLLVASFYRFSALSRWVFYSLSYISMALLMLIFNPYLETEAMDSLFILVFFSLSFFLSHVREKEHIDYFNIRQELMVQREHWKNRSYTDILTGLYNRGYYQETLHYLWEGSVRYKRHFSLALIDIDHFKKVNDTLGHDRGDKVLVDMARVLSDNSRKSDIIARYGGEEFCIILTDTELDGSTIQMNRLRTMIGDYNFLNVPWKVTISVGIAYTTEVQSPDQLSKLADKRLYTSKHEGRNRVTAMDA